MIGNKKQVAVALCALMLALTAAPALAENGSTTKGKTTHNTKNPRNTVSTQRKTNNTVYSITEGDGMISVTRKNPSLKVVRSFPNVSARATAVTLTEEQKAAIEQAQADQKAAKAAYTEKLITVGILSQDAIDAKARIEAAAEVANAVDTMQWTLEKNIILRNTLTKYGAEKAETLGGLVVEGLLTQEQADALYVRTTNYSNINIDNLTVLQARQLQNTINTFEYVALVQDFLAQGLINGPDADILLARRANTIPFSLTEEHMTALRNARSELSAELQAIAETLRDAMGITKPSVDEKQEQAPVEEEKQASVG